MARDNIVHGKAGETSHILKIRPVNTAVSDGEFPNLPLRTVRRAGSNAFPHQIFNLLERMPAWVEINQQGSVTGVQIYDFLRAAQAAQETYYRMVYIESNRIAERNQ